MQALRTVMRGSQLRRLQVALICFSAAEIGTWLAITVFAFEQGGVGEAGLVATAQLMVAALAAPFVASGADRLPRDRVLAAGFAFQAAAFGLVGAAMLVGIADVAVYGLAAVAAASVSLTRPAAGALVPSLVETPDDLVAANVAGSLSIGIGAFAGPAAAGLILGAHGPGWVFAAGALTMTVVCTVALGLRPNARHEPPDAQEEAAGAFRELAAGFSLLRGDPDTRLVVMVVARNFVFLGALDIAVVTVAVDMLGRTEAVAGVLASVAGVGALVGAATSAVLVGRRRLTWPLGLGAMAAGVSLAAAALGGTLVVVGVAFCLGSIGVALSDTAGRTMLQGLAPSDMLARVFGVLEGLSMAGLALGGIGFSQLVLVLGPERALVSLGLALALSVLIRLRRLFTIDRDRPDIDHALLSMVRDVAIFAPLPVHLLERVLVSFVHEVHPAHARIISRGALGNRFFLILDGTAEVRFDEPTEVDHPVERDPVTLGASQFFGEIALVRGVPRTASVYSGSAGVTVASLDRATFLRAIGAHPKSTAHVEAVIRRRGF